MYQKEEFCNFAVYRPAGEVGAVPRVQAVRPVAGRKDTVALSPAAQKVADTLRTLAEQKQKVTEQKNALIAKTLEDGLDLESIEEQLDAFDERLISIDSMMEEVTGSQYQDVGEELATEKKEAAKDDEEPVTEEEALAEDAKALTHVAGGLEQTKLAASVSGRTGRMANVLQAQIFTDKDRVKIRQPKPGDNAAGRQYIADKNTQLRGMRAKARKAYMQSGGMLGGARGDMEAARERAAQRIVLPREEEEGCNGANGHRAGTPRLNQSA